MSATEKYEDNAVIEGCETKRSCPMVRLRIEAQHDPFITLIEVVGVEDMDECFLGSPVSVWKNNNPGLVS